MARGTMTVPEDDEQRARRAERRAAAERERVKECMALAGFRAKIIASTTATPETIGLVGEAGSIADRLAAAEAQRERIAEKVDAVLMVQADQLVAVLKERRTAVLDALDSLGWTHGGNLDGLADGCRAAWSKWSAR